MSDRVDKIKKDRDKVRLGTMTQEKLDKKWSKSSAKRLKVIPRREK